MRLYKSTFQESKLIFLQQGDMHSAEPAAAAPQTQTFDQRTAPAVAAAKKAHAQKNRVMGNIDSASGTVAGKVDAESDHIKDHLYNIGAPLVGSMIAATRMSLNPIVSPIETLKHPFKKVGAPLAETMMGIVASQANMAALPTRIIDKATEVVSKTPSWGPLKIIKWVGEKANKVSGALNYIPNKLAKKTTRGYKATSNWGK